MQPAWEVAHVIRRTDTSQLPLNVHQQKTLRAITQCRTAALGGHVDACGECGSVHISYNSCRNRHCPKCQGHKRIEWIEKRKEDLLPCAYYHVVFTLPAELNPLALHRPKVVYDVLFAAVWATLHQFGKTEGVSLGMIAVLHTWGQNLALHPHLHCIVPGGGIDEKGQWRRQVRSDKYLFAVKALSKVFRAKYVAGLRDSGVADKALLESLFQKQWVVYAKRPFGGPQQVIEHLGRYTHKVAIANHRIQQVDEKDVTFRYKDYKAKGATKLMTLSHEEFTRRFSQHILPPRSSAHPPLWNPKQHLEAGQTTSGANCAEGSKKSTRSKDPAQAVPLLQNRNLDHPGGLWQAWTTKRIFSGKQICSCCLTAVGRGTYVPASTKHAATHLLCNITKATIQKKRLPASLHPSVHHPTTP